MKPTIIIAEAGVNHNGNLETAERLIKAAAFAGADYVKFQTFKADQLLSKSVPKAEYQLKNTSSDESQFEMIASLELSKEDHLKLIRTCEVNQIGFLSSPFDLESLSFLQELMIDYIKIPSGELTNRLLLEKVAIGKEPIIISTGMATLDEIDDALDILTKGGKSLSEITVLHCNTEYPTPLRDVHLRAMDSIAKRFEVQVGYSDHTIGCSVAVASVARGAVMIEKHLTLDNNLPGPDHAASMEPHEFKEMVSMIREVEQALGTTIKAPSPSERKNIAIARKSIHYKTDLPEGHKLKEEDLIMLRPGDGVSPMEYRAFVGRTLRHCVIAQSKLSREHLE